MADFINTIDSLGDEAVVDSIIDKSITEFKDNVLTSLGTRAFDGCGSLKIVSLPECTTAGEYVFTLCTSLEEIYTPKLTSLPGNFCSGAGNAPMALKTIHAPAATLSGLYTFRQCTALESVDFPILTNVGQAAFYNCYALKSVNVPSATKISKQGFMGCRALAVLDLPTVQTIEDTAFTGCTALKAFINRNTETVCTAGTTIFNSTPIASGTGFIYVPGSLVDSYKSATNWSTYANQFRGIIDDEEALQGIIDETLVDYSNSQLQTIADYAFNKYTPLESVSLSNATSVGKQAFRGCSQLTSVDLPNVTSLGSESFADTTALTQVNIPEFKGIAMTSYNPVFNSSSIKSIRMDNATSLPQGFFASCASLTDVYAPKLASLSNSFTNCSSLVRIDLPSLKETYNPCFQYCSNLRAVILRGDTVVNLAHAGTFGGTPIASGTGYIYVPGNLVASYKSATNWSTHANQFRGIVDDEEALQGMIDETLVDYSNSQLQEIPNGAFAQYNQLKTVDLPNVTTIGEYAFSKCTALTDVDCPSITTIDGGYLFSECTSLKNVNLPALTSISYEARNLFAQCKALETISLPNLVTAGRFMFYQCSTLKNASMPKLTSVPRACFQACGLLTIDLPLVTNIDAMGFYQNINLVAVVLRSETMCTLASTNAFDLCCHILGTTLYGANPDKLKDGYIYVPRALVDSYKAATNWSTYATQFRALEDYTVDGTIAGALDETKI